MRRSTRLLVESLESRRLLATVSIPNANSSPGIAPVSILIDSASGVRAAEIRLTYDTDILNISSDVIGQGLVWNGNADTQVTANVDDSAGTIVLFVASANPLGNIGGSLAILNFTLISTAAVGDTATLNLTSVILNEGAIAVTPTPTAGVDTIDGSLTVLASTPTGNGSVTGFVFADANTNSTVDAGEAISGVVVTITNTATGVATQTSSLSDGSYTFQNLAAGNYQIQQQQPAAFFEGGVNTLTVAVTAGSNLTGQNFVEGGLQPAAIFTRLRTTLAMPVNSTLWQSTIANIVQTITTATLAQLNSTGTLNAPALSTQSTLVSLASSQSESPSESQAVAPAALQTAAVASPLVAEGEYAAPLSDIEAREKQRVAAVERALLEL